MTDYPWTTLGVVLVLLVYFWTAIRVGQARGKYGVIAPATSGDPIFDRHYRVQMNTLETMVLLLPALLLALPLLGDVVTGALAAAYALARIIYANAYVKDPASRSAGFGLSMLTVLIALIAAAAAAIRTLL